MSKSDKFWDRKAEGYAKSTISDEESYQKKLNETQAVLSPDMRILEFGCGTGATAVHHAPHVQHIDAIDVSQSMIEIGQRRAAEANINNITFTHGTLSEFNAETASMDAVLGLNVIHLLPDWQSEIAEVARIVKPGGYFVSSTACLGDSYFRFIRYFVPLGKLLGLMPDVFVINESLLVNEIQKVGFTIECQWQHGVSDMTVFIVARKL